jgi:hypothetical protein
MAETEEAYAALEVAVQKLLAMVGEDECIPVDVVLVVGVQKIDDDGDRVGGLHAFPRDGCQPIYITKGLLVHAIDTLRQQSSVE